MLGSVANPTNGPSSVSLTGTQRTFQVTNLVINACGTLTNYVAGYAGGLDITSAATNALAVTGAVSLVFAQYPVAAPTNYWGLRWLGTNHVAYLNTYHANVPSRLTWSDSALSPAYQGQVGIYTGSENNVAYTYVGIQVTKVLDFNKGSVLLLR